MMSLVAFNTGWIAFIDKVEFYFLMYDIKLDANAYNVFYSNVFAPAVAKPIYGWISDSFYPFKLR